MLRRDPFEDPRELIRSVYAYVAYRIGDGPDAEDVTSETFARALRYRDSYDASKGPAIGWLIGIARRCLADVVAAPRMDELDEEADGAAAVDVEQDSLRRLTMRSAVATLDDSDRELIALRYGADLKARQIAELTGRTTNAVEVALHRALARLRGQLEAGDAPAVRKELPRTPVSPVDIAHGGRP